MASGISTWGATTWLSALFGVTSPITGYYVALCSEEPSDDSDGTLLADIEPPSGSNYARQAYAAGASNWGANGDFLLNLTEIVFPIPFTDWGYLSHYALCSAASGGEIYAWGAFTNPQTVTVGYRMTIPVGGVVLSLSSLEGSITQ